MEWRGTGGRIGSYRELLETPANVVRHFMWIDEEVNALAN